MAFQLIPFLIQMLVSVAISAAVTLVQAALKQDQKRTSGVRGEIQTGGDNPLAFIVGKYATGGQLEYVGTWGSDGNAPNAYFTKVVSVSDLPVRGLSGFYVNGARVTFADTPHADMGYPVLEFRVNGKDHMWVKFYDGTQTAADPYLLAKFGDDPDYPWESDMIGRGVAHFIATALVNRELFPNFPDYLAEIDGIPLATGKHENPIEGVRKVLLGLSYDGVWLYGPQGVTTNHLQGFDAQSDKCDVSVTTTEGTEARFRFGYEIRVDQEPHAVIGEFLKACQGRIAEIGGRYKVLVGEPDAPVASFTDEDIVISQGQSFTPFPGLDATYNAITATYPEPLEAWGNKDAPPRYSDTLEGKDDGRRLPMATDFKAVPFPNQVQRNMRAMIEEARRFRRHSFTAPPAWWEYEPLDTVEWTSAHNEYSDKLFLLTVMDDLPNGNQIVGLQEQDAADYEWSTAYELPYDVTPLEVFRPPAQPMTGWTVEPYIFVDASANSRRPGIRVKFAAGQDDVRAVQVQVRLAATEAGVFDGEAPYDAEAAEPSIVPQGTFLANTEYEARGKFVPFSGRATEWSSWLAVTTPDVGITRDDLDPRLDARIRQIEKQIPAVLAELQRQMEELSASTMGGFAARIESEGNILQGVGSRYEQNRATAIEAIGTAADANGALAFMFSSLLAKTEAGESTGLIRFVTVATPEDSIASYAIELRADFESEFARTGFYMDAGAFEDGSTSRIRFVASQIWLETPGGSRRNALLFAQNNESRNAPIVDGEIRADLSDLEQNHHTLITGNVLVKAPIGLFPGARYSHAYEMDDVGGHDVTFDTGYMLPHPTINTTPGVTTYIDHYIRSINPLRIISKEDAQGVEVPVLTLRDHLHVEGNNNNAASLAGLDFEPGCLLVVVGSLRRTSGDVDRAVTINEAIVSDWAQIGGTIASVNGLSRMRARAMMKIATGVESSLQMFDVSGGLSNTNGMSYDFYSFDFFGAPATLGAVVNVNAMTGNSNGPSQTIETGDNPAPSVAFSYAAGVQADVPDQSFSVTPDRSDESSVTNIRTRCKVKRFTSAPSDITTQFNHTGGNQPSRNAAHISFHIFLDY